MMLFRFLGWMYIKLFLVIFIGMELFFVMMESTKYGEDLPNSANLIILFLFYDSVYAMTYVLPISLLLSSVAFYWVLLKHNYLATLLSLGYSRTHILRVLLVLIVLAVLAQIAISSTKLAYAQESAESILYGTSSLSSRNDVFLKHDNKYIVMDKIAPIFPDGAKATNIRVYEVDDITLNQYYQADEAYFLDNHWVLQDSVLVSVSPHIALGKKNINIQNVGDVALLKGFRPKILDAIAKDKPTISVLDGIEALKIATKEGNNSSKIRSVLYMLVILPFFVPLTIIIISYYIPPFIRYGNIALIGFISGVIGLGIWGIIYSLGEFGASGFFIPEIGVLVPFLVLFIVAMIHRARLNKRI